MVNKQADIPLSEQAELPLEEEKKIEERVAVAPPLTLMWWKFRKHKAALISAVILILFYFVAIFAEFIAPYGPDDTFVRYTLAPPSPLHLVDDQGQFHGPFVYKIKRTVDLETLAKIYTEEKGTIYPIRLFAKGTPYKLWGLIDADIHLFGLDVPQDEQGVLIFGADRLGRDMFSRVIYGARISLSLGLVGVFMSLLLGIIIGGISGYFGGAVDNFIQRAIEFIRSIPTIPLWMGLSAALPVDMPVIQVYFGITIILSLVSWTGMARVVRGRFLALREEDFVLAARLSGSRQARIIMVHMVPSFLSHIIATLTLNIPGMILSETGLSFIGLGLRPPAISWGVLLQEAMNVSAIALAPWVFWPAVAVVTAVLCFNFLGDGLRDAADPYTR
jgi:peptide/nickel transport system permease protein